jgi:(2Fe-2S) ferredoxin
MSEAPGPTDLATTQLLSYRAVGGNEEAWRGFVLRYRPRILCWYRRLQADDAEEVASRVLHTLEEEGQAESAPSVGNGTPP